MGVYHSLSQIFTLFFEKAQIRKARQIIQFLVFCRAFLLILWSRIRDSNPPPTAWEALKSGADSLNAVKMVAYWELIISAFSFAI